LFSGWKRHILSFYRRLKNKGFRHRLLDSIPVFGSNEDRCAGLELLVEEDGTFSFAGVPPESGFRARFHSLMLERGVSVATSRNKDLK
jgi:hypothetical protein